jgi:chromosomal replication initiator protein
LTGHRFLLVPENRSAYAAVAHLAECVGAGSPDRAPNLLFLHGPAGSGKTRLVSVLLAEVTRRRPELIVRVLPADEFEALARAADAAEEGDSLRTVRQADVLVLEDVQHVGSRRPETPATEALCRLLDYRAARTLPTVCTATAGPARLGHWPARLAGRFASGLVVGIAPLGPASRLKYLHEQAQRRQLAVHPDVLAWLAKHLTGAGRQLDGALARLETLARLHDRLDVTAVAEHFREEAEAGRPTVERITRRVGAYYRVEPAQLQSRRRYPKIVLPRQVSMYLARQLTGLSLEQIGRYFGGRDHTTVLYACRKVEQALARDATLSGTVRQLEADLT